MTTSVPVSLLHSTDRVVPRACADQMTYRRRPTVQINRCRLRHRSCPRQTFRKCFHSRTYRRSRPLPEIWARVRLDPSANVKVSMPLSPLNWFWIRTQFVAGQYLEDEIVSGAADLDVGLIEADQLHAVAAAVARSRPLDDRVIAGPDAEQIGVVAARDRSGYRCHPGHRSYRRSRPRRSFRRRWCR